MAAAVLVGLIIVLGGVLVVRRRLPLASAVGADALLVASYVLGLWI